jgi:DNA polymerase III delta prime subunit
MKDLLINKFTRARLTAYSNKPASVLLLVGAAGSGKKELSRVLAETILEGERDSLINKGKLMILPAGAGIEDVRALIRELAIKAPAGRCIIIHDVDKLRHEAQNALLKTLEQAAPATHFILSSSYPSGVLATIRSRSTTIAVKPVSLPEAAAFYKGTSKE